MGQYIANGDGNVPLHGPNTDGVDLPYHTNAAGYCVLDKTYKDPNNRRIRVVTIGAGYSGILLAYRIPRELENVEVWQCNMSNLISKFSTNLICFSMSSTKKTAILAAHG